MPISTCPAKLDLLHSAKRSSSISSRSIRGIRLWNSIWPESGRFERGFLEKPLAVSTKISLVCPQMCDFPLTFIEDSGHRNFWNFQKFNRNCEFQFYKFIQGFNLFYSSGCEEYEDLEAHLPAKGQVSWILPFITGLESLRLESSFCPLDNF